MVSIRLRQLDTSFDISDKGTIEQLLSSAGLCEGVFDQSFATFLPSVIVQGDALGKGVSSCVHRVLIRGKAVQSASRDELDCEDGLSGDFAMKCIHKVEDAQREQLFLEGLHGNRIQHNNLLMTYCGFSVGEKYYTISDRANMDLKELFTKVNASQIGVDARWVREQFHDLADALRCIHDFNPGSQTACLNDIKPANLLIFGDRRPTLKFTDWGHTTISDKPRRGSGVNFMLGDASYQPPECCEVLTSRQYDIWSLGCVFIELLVWFDKGTRGYQQFFDARGRLHALHDIQANAFYHDGKIEGSVMRELMDLESGSGCWADIVGVIRDMLKIKPKERPTAEYIGNIGLCVSCAQCMLQ